MGSKLVQQQQLRKGGIEVVGDIVDRFGKLLQWEERRQTDLPERLRGRYIKLLDNIDLQADKVKCRRAKTAVFVTQGQISDGSIIWRYRIEHSKVADRLDVGADMGGSPRAFTHVSGTLFPALQAPPFPDLPLFRIHAGMPRTSSNYGTTLSLIARPEDDTALALQFRWDDGRSIFDTSTQNLRNLLNKRNDKTHCSIVKWTRYTSWVPNTKLMWGKIWASFIPEKISCLAWQVAHRVIATNRWRFNKVPDPDVRKKCDRCSVCDSEDVNHCMWGCHKANLVWQWIARLSTCTAQDQSQQFFPSVTHALMGEPLPDSIAIPVRWWELLRLSAMWYVWLARNAETFQEKPEPLSVTKVKVWHQIKIVMRSEWGKVRSRGALDDRAMERARYLFEFQFGSNDEIYTIDDYNQIQICRIPPEPD